MQNTYWLEQSPL